jgi:hypothetical protein
MTTVADHEVESKVGELTGRIAPGTIGEVIIPIRGGTEAFHAYAAHPDEVIEVGTQVLVVERVGPRSVKVVPFSYEEGAPSQWSLQQSRRSSS